MVLHLRFLFCLFSEWLTEERALYEINGSNTDDHDDEEDEEEEEFVELERFDFKFFISNKHPVCSAYI